MSYGEELKLGSKGNVVIAWQNFLIGKGLLKGPADGNFGELTAKATIKYKEPFPLCVERDGSFSSVVDEFVWNQADRDSIHKYQESWPPKPDRVFPTTQQQRALMFGEIKFIPDPVPQNPEQIKIINNWQKNNLVSVYVPQLKNIKGANNGNILFHKNGKEQLLALFNRWEQEKLLSLIRTFDGAWVPRFIRGSTTALSNHAYGSAFDINAGWNPLGKPSKLKGQTGVVRELAAVCYEYGFFWLGWSETRPDPMHFEIVTIK